MSIIWGNRHIYVRSTRPHVAPSHVRGHQHRVSDVSIAAAGAVEDASWHVLTWDCVPFPVCSYLRWLRTKEVHMGSLMHTAQVYVLGRDQERPGWTLPGWSHGAWTLPGWSHPGWSHGACGPPPRGTGSAPSPSAGHRHTGKSVETCADLCVFVNIICSSSLIWICVAIVCAASAQGLEADAAGGTAGLVGRGSVHQSPGQAACPHQQAAPLVEPSGSTATLHAGALCPGLLPQPVLLVGAVQDVGVQACVPRLRAATDRRWAV